LRNFVVASGDDYVVMPGGLTRVAAKKIILLFQIRLEELAKTPGYWHLNLTSLLAYGLNPNAINKLMLSLNR